VSPHKLHIETPRFWRDPPLMCEELIHGLAKRIDDWSAIEKIAIVEKYGDFTHALRTILVDELKKMSLEELIEKTTILALNVLTTGSLRHEWDIIRTLPDGPLIQHLEENQYDIIIANPPYQDVAHKESKSKSWQLFLVTSLQQAIKAEGYLVFVSPHSWRALRSTKWSGMADTEGLPFDIVTKKNSLLDLWPYMERHFPDGMTRWGVILRNRNSTDETLTTLNYNKETSEEINLHGLDFLPESVTPEIIELCRSIYNGCDTYESVKSDGQHSQQSRGKLWNEEDEGPTEQYPYPIFHASPDRKFHTKEKLEHTDKEKIIFSRNGYQHEYYDKEGKFTCSEEAYYIEIENQEHANSILALMKSKVWGLYLRQVQSRGNTWRLAVMKIPRLSLKEGASEEDILGALPLSEDVRKAILELIKEKITPNIDN
jgi:hypothetical protein